MRRQGCLRSIPGSLGGIATSEEVKFLASVTSVFGASSGVLKQPISAAGGGAWFTESMLAPVLGLY